MKTKLAVLVFAQIPAILLAQADSTYNGKAGLADVADEDPGLFLLMMFILLGFVAIIITLTILILLFVALAGVLTFCGVLSVSVINGLYRRSFTSGAILFIKMAMALAGSATGGAFGFLLKALLHFNISPMNTLLTGILAGGIVGWLIGYTMVKALRMLLQKLTAT